MSSPGFFGIGTDLVETDRMARCVAKSHFVAKVFGVDECAYCSSKTRPSEHFAARFAAKEAFLKSLGKGVFSGVDLRDIQVVNDASGAPHLKLGPTAVRAVIQATDVNFSEVQTFVSLSHVRHLALATVVVRVP